MDVIEQLNLMGNAKTVEGGKNDSENAGNGGNDLVFRSARVCGRPGI